MEMEAPSHGLLRRLVADVVKEVIPPPFQHGPNGKTTQKVIFKVAV